MIRAERAAGTRGRRLPIGLWRALTQNSAETAEDALDPRLRGRTYRVPFADVWDEIVEMVRTRARWTLIRADEDTGIITAEATTRWLGFVDYVSFRLSLDENALTRLDMRSASRVGHADFGVNARRIARFLRDLDRRLGVGD